MSSHIAILLPSLTGGGAEKILLKIAEEITERGYNLDLIIIFEEGPYKDRIPEQANVISLRADRAITALPELVSYLSKSEPDSLLTSLQVPNIVAILSKLISRSSSDIFVRVSNVHSEKKRDSIKHQLLPILIKETYQYSDTVIAISEDVKTDLITTYGVPANKIKTINNPSFSEEIIQLREETPAHTELFQDDRDIILSVGRLHPQKDFQTLIRAFAQLPSSIDAKLVILGEGEQRSELETVINQLGLGEEVFLPGFVSNPYSYMYRADVFVLPSLFEGFPNVLVEALACRCPVIATDSPGGSREILQDGEYGELVKLQDPSQLSQRITALLTGKITYDKLELESHARTFSKEKIVDQYLDVL